jgi:RNA polymerase sigma-70 factor (ECF subfamily)
MRENDEHRWSSLMVSAQAGNESDYRQLLQELAGVIQSFLRSRFGNYDFIEDCVQESLIAVHQARHTYDPKRPFRPWLFAIVRNKAIDLFRQQRTREKAFDHFQREHAVLSQPDNQDFYRREITEGRLLELLSEQHKEVLVLTKIIGFSVAETAGKLGISEGAVKVRVYRAIRKLQQLLEKDAL